MDGSEIINQVPQEAPMVTSKWAENEDVYIGTKVIRGVPMTEYEFLRTVKEIPKEELISRETQGEGYKVTYEDGYVSWSPKQIFEQCYRKVSLKERSLLF